MLNVANNHAIDHGLEAFLESTSRLSGLGIAMCGLRGTDGWASQPITREERGLRIGFLGYSLRPGAEAAREHPHAEPSETEILADVRRLRPEIDCLVVSLHWGEEFAPLPSAGEVVLAHSIAEAGATIVLGHHPHVARPVERYRGAVIAYSLGNFAGDMVWYEPLREGLALACDVTRSGVKTLRIFRTRIGTNYLPAVPSGGAEVAAAACVSGLVRAEYVGLARSTVAAERRALYLYTLRNAWRFRPKVLVELVGTTVRGKLRRLLGGHRDEIWG